MKLMQVMAGAPHGGAEGFFERHTIAMTEAGLDQIAVVREDYERAARLRDGGVTVHEAKFGGMLDIFTKSEIAGLASRFKPDVVMAWMNRAAAKTPKGDYVLCARLGGYYDLKYYKRCDYLIGNTPGIRQYLIKEGWPENKARYLPNFVDENPGTPVNRAQFDTPSDAPLIFALGRLHTVKGFDVLFDALKGVPDAILWLAGEGPERAALEKHASDVGVSDRVRFLGWRADINDLMATADIMVCPSRHEPLGNVILDGWAQGVPVISTATAGPKDMIQDGADGLLVPIEDADALRAAIVDLAAAEDRRRVIGEGGLKALRQQFSKDAVVKQYLDFFRDVTRFG